MVQMSWGFMVVVISISYLIILWGLANHLFLNRNQTKLLSLLLTVIIAVATVYRDFYSVFLIFLFIIVHLFLSVSFLKNWILASYLIILEYTLISLSWFLTFDLPRVIIHIDFFATFSAMLFFHIIQQIILVLLILVSRRVIKKLDIISTFQVIQKKYRNRSLICLLSLTIFIAIHHGQTYPQHTESFFYTFLIFIILFSLLTFMTWFSRKQQQDILSLEMKQSTINNLQKSMTVSEEFRHDYKNLLIVLLRLLDNNQLPEAKDYLNSLINYSNEVLASDYQEQLNKLELFQVQNFLYTFLASTLDSDIDVSFTISEPISSIKMNLIDYIRCISILLNNSKEYLQEIENPKLFITFKLEENTVIFSIKNNICEPIPLEKIFTKKYSTKKNHTGNGLAILQKIVRSYRGSSVYAESNANYFTVNLIVPYK